MNLNIKISTLNSHFRKVIFCLLLFLCDQAGAQFNSTYNVMTYGAKGDGVSLDTEAVRKAVAECALTGGSVLFPAGKYLIGSVKLESNTEIYLAQGALILGSSDIKDYEEYTPELKSFNDYFLKHSVFYAEKAENIGIRGEGTIDGQGHKFVVKTKKKPDRYKNRPFVIRFVECKNIRIENIALQNSAMWMQQYLACENLFVRGIRVYNHGNQNNDMIDIDGCKNVLISDCIGDTDDDALTLKSTSERVTENVTISNCVLSSHCNALKMGTESTGGFKNIVVSNIMIKPSDAPDKIYGEFAGICGINLAMVDGGVVDGISISNVRIDGTQVPIYMRLGNRGRKHYDGAEEPGIGSFKNINISDVDATNVESSIGSSITGIPSQNIEHVSLNNITITYPGGGRAALSDKVVEELEDYYPESTKWGELPAFGFYVRHANNITFNNVEVRYQSDDYRPAFTFDDVQGISMYNSRASANLRSESIMRFTNCSDVMISGFKSYSKANVLATFSGSKTDNVLMVYNNLHNIKRAFKVGQGVSKDLILVK